MFQAKPLLQQGSEKLLDTRLKLTSKNTRQVSRMIQAAAACINNEESRRPHMGEILTILRGKESRKKAILTGNSPGTDFYPQLHRTKSEMKSHLALAMLGVDLDDDDHQHSR